MSAALEAGDKILNSALRVAAVVLVLGMLTVVCGSVALRALGTVVFGADELTRLLLTWTVAVGVVLGAREGGHLAIEAVTDRLTGWTRRSVLGLGAIVSIGFLLILTWTGLQYAIAGFTRGAPTPSLGISTGWAALSWPVCGFLTMLYVLRDLVAGVTVGPPDPPDDAEVSGLV
ncbi:TRAP transporter small permease [Ruania zhangjianzhongii]|uniref:TRAP transporter small permease n=1 Tax=Ruania zhangjianzhongii TaxID=2603206 RepID=UPI0011CAFCB0|nr:TRAP transporter small permease [Ruania zhangjianzhongii]